jgi:hypothetical protein
MWGFSTPRYTLKSTALHNTLAQITHKTQRKIENRAVNQLYSLVVKHNRLFSLFGQPVGNAYGIISEEQYRGK